MVITRESLELFDAMQDHTVYRFVSPEGQVTLGKKHGNAVHLFGFGNGTRISVGCNEWDRRIREGGGGRIRHIEGRG